MPAVTLRVSEQEQRFYQQHTQVPQMDQEGTDAWVMLEDWWAAPSTPPANPAPD